MSYESDDKMVSHPDHYQSGKYEVIDIIEEFTKDLSGIEAVDTGNAIKYILRWHKKNGKQDVKKAIWYLTHLAEHLEEKENPSKPHSVIIHKMADGHYAIEDIKDDEKIDEDEPKAKETIEDTSFVKSSEYIQEEKYCIGCEHWQTRYSEEPCNSCHDHEHWVPRAPKKNVAPQIDKEESKLCAENHINSVGICVPDSEPWKKEEK